jgi:flagellar basal body P-ring formation protein FlgA
MNLNCLGGVIGFFLLLVSAGALAMPAQIHVRHEAQVASSNVELGAIADIKSTDADNERDLAALILGESPGEGQSVVWTAAEISTRLHPYNRLLRDAQLKLPDNITIRRAATSVPRETLKTQIEGVLKATLPDSSWEAQVIDVNTPSGLHIPPDGTVQIGLPMTRPQGAANFEVLVYQDSQLIARQWVAARVRYFAKVAILTREVEARTHISSIDLKWERRDVTTMMDIPATPADMSSAVAGSNLMPGTILTRSQLEREMALRFGDEVDVNTGDDTFVVSTKGVAQQNGYVGDTVKVRSLATNKILTGIVTAQGVIHVPL